MYLKINIPDIRLIPLDHLAYMWTSITFDPVSVHKWPANQLTSFICWSTKTWESNIYTVFLINIHSIFYWLGWYYNSQCQAMKLKVKPSTVGGGGTAFLVGEGRKWESLKKSTDFDHFLQYCLVFLCITHVQED